MPYRQRPARLDGKVERSHRIDDDEFYRMLEGVVVDNTQLSNTKLQAVSGHPMEAQMKMANSRHGMVDLGRGAVLQ